MQSHLLGPSIPVQMGPNPLGAVFVEVTGGAPLPIVWEQRRHTWRLKLVQLLIF